MCLYIYICTVCIDSEPLVNFKYFYISPSSKLQPSPINHSLVIINGTMLTFFQIFLENNVQSILYCPYISIYRKLDTNSSFYKYL